MKVVLVAIALLFVMVSAGHCHAAAPKQNAISYEPFAILSRGMVLQYERLAGPSVSLIGGAGARWAARDDFASQTLLLKLELRFWLGSRSLPPAERPMQGSFLGFGAVVARTELENLRSDRTLGAMWQLQESLRFGYRFVVFDLQELTPSVGLNLVHDFDEQGRLAPSTLIFLGANFTVGWMF